MCLFKYHGHPARAFRRSRSNSVEYCCLTKKSSALPSPFYFAGSAHFHDSSTFFTAADAVSSCAASMVVAMM
jgi:hypothetical protein